MNIKPCVTLQIGGRDVAQPHNEMLKWVIGGRPLPARTQGPLWPPSSSQIGRRTPSCGTSTLRESETGRAWSMNYPSRQRRDSGWMVGSGYKHGTVSGG